MVCLIATMDAYSGEYGGSLMEEILETQIDPRLPSSFPTTELLVVRLDGFPGIIKADGSYHVVPNWEVYARDYWYETRFVNMSCPQLPSGISATTDWTLTIPCLFGDTNVLPKTVFVHSLMLPHFVESTLNFMSKKARFVLIISGTDATIPRSTGDLRYSRKVLRGFQSSSTGGEYWQKLINDKRILHMYVEGRDLGGPKVSTLPTGFTFDLLHIMNGTYNSPEYNNKHIIKLPLEERPLTVLTADRTRDRRGQWYDRAQVQEMCEKHEWCESLPEIIQEGLNHEDFIKKMHLHPFITCVHGGGVDPSPKAFEAIHEGTIPILRKSIVYDAYRHLPVAWVDTWEELFTPENVGMSSNRTLLRRWIDELGPYYVEGSKLRTETLNKLKLSHWREVIMKTYETELAKDQRRKNRRMLRSSSHFRYGE